MFRSLTANKKSFLLLLLKPDKTSSIFRRLVVVCCELRPSALNSCSVIPVRCIAAGFLFCSCGIIGIGEYATAGTASLIMPGLAFGMSGSAKSSRASATQLKKLSTNENRRTLFLLTVVIVQGDRFPLPFYFAVNPLRPPDFLWACRVTWCFFGFLQRFKFETEGFGVSGDVNPSVIICLKYIYNY